MSLTNETLITACSGLYCGYQASATRNHTNRTASTSVLCSLQLLAGAVSLTRHSAFYPQIQAISLIGAAALALLPVLTGSNSKSVYVNIHNCTQVIATVSSVALCIFGAPALGLCSLAGVIGGSLEQKRSHRAYA